MITETLIWHEVTEQLPDDAKTVLYEAPESDEPVWLGYYQDGQWYEAGGFDIEGVVRWAEMPRGGLR